MEQLEKDLQESKANEAVCSLSICYSVVGEKRYAELQSYLKTLQDEKAAFKSQVDELEQTVTELKRENEELRNEKNRLTLQKDDVTDLAEKYEKQIEGLKEECLLDHLVMDRLQSLEAKNHMLDQARDSISSLGSRKVCEICEFEVDICYSGYGWG